MSVIFISHSEKDGKKAAEGIRLALSVHAAQINLSVADLEVCIAPEFLRGGGDIDADIWMKIRECRWFLLLVTPESIQSWYVAYEVGRADDHKKTILPILGEGMTPNDLPDPIKRKGAISLTDIGKMTEMLSDIVQTIKREKAEAEQKARDAWMKELARASQGLMPDFSGSADTPGAKYPFGVGGDYKFPPSRR